MGTGISEVLGGESCFCTQPSSPVSWKKHFLWSGSCSSSQTSFSEFFQSPYDPGLNLSCRLSLETGKSDQKAFHCPGSVASAVMRPGHQMAPQRPLRSQGRGGRCSSRGGFNGTAPLGSESNHTASPLASGCRETVGKQVSTVTWPSLSASQQLLPG